MKKLLLAALMLVSIGAVAQQSAVGPWHIGQMPMMMQNCPMQGVMMGSAEVKYEATPTGANLVFTPKDPAKLSELQERIREMAERMNKGMMMGGKQ